MWSAEILIIVTIVFERAEFKGSVPGYPSPDFIRAVIGCPRAAQDFTTPLDQILDLRVFRSENDAVFVFGDGGTDNKIGFAGSRTTADIALKSFGRKGGLLKFVFRCPEGRRIGDVRTNFGLHIGVNLLYD